MYIYCPIVSVLSLSLSHPLSKRIFSSVVFFCFVVVVKSLSGRPPGDLVCAHTSYTRLREVCGRGEKTTQTRWVPGAIGGWTRGETARVYWRGRSGGREESPTRPPFVGPQRRTSHVVWERQKHLYTGIKSIYILLQYVMHHRLCTVTHRRVLSWTMTMTTKTAWGAKRTQNRTRARAPPPRRPLSLGQRKVPRTKG